MAFFTLTGRLQEDPSCTLLFFGLQVNHVQNISGFPVPKPPPKQVRNTSISPGSAVRVGRFFAALWGFEVKVGIFLGGAKKCHLFLRPENRGVMKGPGLVFQ